MHHGKRKRTVERSLRVKAVLCTYFGSKNPRFTWPAIKSAAGQREVCPETKREHWQVFLYFGGSERSIREIQKQCNMPGAHIESVKGTYQQAWDYCTKAESRIPGSTFRLGTCPAGGGQGHRGDLDQLAEAYLRDGYDGIPDSAIIKYHRGLDKLALVRAKPAQPEAKTVHWYFGESGTGKSDTCARSLEGKRYFKAPPRGGWFDGYVGQQYLWIDELDEKSYSTSELLSMLDRYAYTFPQKGSYVPCRVREIFITSHYHPRHYVEESRWPELKRRITDLKKFTWGSGGVSITSPTSPPLS